MSTQLDELITKRSNAYKDKIEKKRAHNQKMNEKMEEDRRRERRANVEAWLSAIPYDELTEWLGYHLEGKNELSIRIVNYPGPGLDLNETPRLQKYFIDEWPGLEVSCIPRCTSQDKIFLFDTSKQTPCHRMQLDLKRIDDDDDDDDDSSKKCTVQ